MAVAAPSAGGERSAAASPPQPPSWPTAAARSAAYSLPLPRQPVQDVAAQVHGQLPPWLAGTYIRNGPGDFAAMVSCADVGVVPSCHRATAAPTPCCL